MENKKTNIIFISVVLFLLFVIGILFFLLNGFKKGITITINYVNGEKKSIYLEEGEYLELPEKQIKENHLFCGWTNQNGRYVINTSNVKDEDELSPMFIDSEEAFHSLTFYDQEKILGEINLVEDGEFSLPVEPLKEGYKFVGWVNNDGQLISNHPIIFQDKSFHALWIPEGVETVQIEYQSDSLDDYGPVLIEKGSFLLLTETPIKNGYLFTGWKKNTDEVVDGSTIVDNSIILMADWKNSYICPDGCSDMGDGRCRKENISDYIDSGTCPDGYEYKERGCYNFNNRYMADFSGDEPSCREGDYKYYEIDHLGADVWCAPRGEVSLKKECPSGYKDTGSNCTYQEIIYCS